MKLKTFNAQNVQSMAPRTSRPYASINTRTGLFNFNKAAIDLVGLSDGDQVQFHQDEENPENWYIERVKTDGFVVRLKENVTKGMLFNSTRLARMIFASVKCELLSGRVYIGEQVKNGKQTLYTVITVSLNANS